MTTSAIPATLSVDAAVTKTGMDIVFNGEHFPIEYPEEIWNSYDDRLKQVLLENIALSSTLFLPLILDRSEVTYGTGRPLNEPYLFLNGIYDMPTTAISDSVSSREYVRKFFNVRRSYKRNAVIGPDAIRYGSDNGVQHRAVVPFSFGKESLLSFCIARELGLDPVPVMVVEPANTYEFMHKKKLIEEFTKVTGVPVHLVKYGPGILRSGRHFGMQTELGWGLQTTEYSLLSLPFLHAFGGDTLILGNEQSCNDVFLDREGMLVHKAAYDQHGDWTPQQSALTTFLLGKKVTVTSFIEPLYELAITRILHGRYPDIGKFQMSCMADSENAKTCRWCQRCVKCSYMFALAAGAGVDLAGIGFTENLFDADHAGMYEYFFNYDPQNPVYGSQEELGLAFLLAERGGHRGASIDRFKRELADRFQKDEPRLTQKYLGITPSNNMHRDLGERILGIYHEELDRFAQS